MIQISMLPALDGDCLIIAYDGSDGRIAHVVIDCGRKDTYARLRPRLQAMKERQERFELLVLTHIDDDHLAGAIEFLNDEDPPIVPEQVWYNGRHVLSTVQAMGFATANALAPLLAKRQWPVNSVVDGDAIFVPETGPLPTFTLPGGMRLTLLSPDREALEKLAIAWAKYAPPRNKDAINPGGGVQVMGRAKKAVPESLDLIALAAKAEDPDDSVVNGSSIAFVAEHGDQRLVMAADAHPRRLVSSIFTLLDGRTRYPIDVLKVPHHGSSRNITRDLASVIDCRRFAISTDGGHDRPDPEAIARLVAYASPGEVNLVFNYRQAWSTIWEGADNPAGGKILCSFPEDDLVWRAP